MKLQPGLSRGLLAGLLTVCLGGGSLLADLPGEKKSSRRSRGLSLDIGRFTPYARGIKIDIGPRRAGKRSVNVQVGPGPYVPVDINVRVNENHQPVFAERPGFDTNSPFAAPSFTAPKGNQNRAGQFQPDVSKESDLLGSPAEEGPALLSPDAALPDENKPGQDEPPAPEETSGSIGVPLSAPPEPARAVVSTSRERAYLGVSVRPVSSAMAAQFANLVPRGAGLQLTLVGRGSAAESAGLRRHDILVTFDKQPVGSLAELSALVRQHQPGDEVELSWLRASRLQKGKVKLGKRTSPVPVRQELQQVQTDPQKLDFRATELPPSRRLVVPLPGGRGFVEVGTWQPGPAPVIAPGTPDSLKRQPVIDPHILPQSGTEQYYSPRGQREKRARRLSGANLSGQPAGSAEKIDVQTQ